MSDYIPSPTFSEKLKSKQSLSTVVNKPPFPDLVRRHHLPLVLKTRSGDSVQVYIISYSKKDENGVLVYDVEFDDGAVKENVPRSALSVPPATNYQIMRLQESQEGAATPRRERDRKRRHNR